MRKFLQATFKSSTREVLAILVLVALKYVLDYFRIFDKISRPFVWLCFGAAVLFLVAAAIIGIVENKGESFESWEAETYLSKKKRLIATFVKWAQFIPTVLAYLLFIYFITPTTLAIFVAFVVGIILRNSVQFFKHNQSETKQEVN